MRPWKRISRAVLALASVVLVGCGVGPVSVGTSSSSISFREIFERREGTNFEIDQTVTLDVDADGEEEWLVLYRFDPTVEEAWDNTPVHGVLYDAINCINTPVIREYRLPTPDNDYLSEGDLSVAIEDVLESPSKADAQLNELLIYGPGTKVDTLAIYRFFDRRGSPCQSPDDAERGFNLLGFFRANSGITRTGDTIVTKERTVYERSQLAIRKTYTPKADPTFGESYLQPNGKLIQPDEQTVDFTFGLPDDPRDSPYPEKAVATYYLALGADPEKSRSFLADNLQSAFPTGLPIEAGQVGRVLIYSLSYTPNVEAELQRQDRTVEAVVAAVDSNGRLSPPRRVRWRLVGVTIPERQDCEWRLAELVSVTTLAPGEIEPIAALSQPSS